MTWRPLPTGVASAPKHLGGSLDRVARELGMPDAKVLATVFGRWEEIVGPAMAATTRPLWLGDGALVVGVGDPSLAIELRYRGADILRRVAEVAGAPVADRLEVRVRARR
ncbi:MAG TPA: DUF721 domain-containing protein [Acidimicrobiales bacterium]|nr:DUF721 domain-containing protein [Acidimicrobiales bacterium]